MCLCVNWRESHSKEMFHIFSYFASNCFPICVSFSSFLSKASVALNSHLMSYFHFEMAISFHMFDAAAVAVDGAVGGVVAVNNVRVCAFDGPFGDGYNRYILNYSYFSEKPNPHAF